MIYYYIFLQVKEKYGVRDEIELVAMLKFYHELGHIIYFGDGDKKSQLRDVVILNPQWLIDAFRKVISVKPPKEQVSIMIWYPELISGQMLTQPRAIQ